MLRLGNVGTLLLSLPGAKYVASLTTDILTANRTWTLPDATGTVALTSGFTMLGDLTLKEDPTTDLMAATKQYVDTIAIAFMAHMSANQSIAASTFTKVQFDTEDFDSGDGYDTTNYRWTPGKAGLILISASVGLTAINDGKELATAVYKNGSALKEVATFASAIGEPTTAIVILDKCSATDYYEIFSNQTDSTSQAVDSTTTISWFSGQFMGAPA